jgi:Neutral/alkaline non-lysosomal ceramidase, N-terminal
MSEDSCTPLRHPEFRGRIGVARAAITPPLGIYARAWGSATHDIAEGVHRPLLASAIVFQDSSGSTELVLITMDVMIFWQEEADKIRAAILERLGLKPHQLILHPSHSHSTPFLLPRQVNKPGGHLIPPYLASIPIACCDLIDAARASAHTATLTWAYGRCGLAFNRDAVDPATGRDICGLNPAQKADNTLLVGRVTDDSGKVRATIVNYACHPVSLGGGNRLFSPDYVGAMREIVEKETAGAVCVFFQGAAGDVTPRRSYEADVEAADQNGRELGYAALSTLASMFPPGQRLEYRGIEESGTALGIWRLTAKPVIASEISGEVVSTKLPIKAMPSRREIEEQLATATESFEIERLERAMDRRKLVGDGKQGSLPFTVWRLGESFLVATPAEPYTQFQVSLRERFPDAAIAVLMASDGSKNYLPLPLAFKRDVYQVRVALFDVGSLESATDQVSHAIREASALPSA